MGQTPATPPAPAGYVWVEDLGWTDPVLAEVQHVLAAARGVPSPVRWERMTRRSRRQEEEDPF